jgi:hypothetical protein
MKKSLIFRLAQIAVLNSATLGNSEKLEILRELMDRESVALFTEKQKEKEKANEAV